MNWRLREYHTASGKLRLIRAIPTGSGRLTRDSSAPARGIFSVSRRKNPVANTSSPSSSGFGRRCSRCHKWLSSEEIDNLMVLPSSSPKAICEHCVNDEFGEAAKFAGLRE